MPDLLTTLVEKDEKPAVFPIREYWLDIGQMGDFERADKEYIKEAEKLKTSAV